MTIFEAVGMAWVILTSTMATVGIFALAWRGLKGVVGRKVADPMESLWWRAEDEGRPR